MLDLFGSVGAEGFALTGQTMNEQIARLRKHFLPDASDLPRQSQAWLTLSASDSARPWRHGR